MDPSTPKVFTAQCRKKGKGVDVLIPFSPQETWGDRARYDITGTVNDSPIRGNLKQEEEHFILRLGPAWIRDFGELDTQVEVSLSLEGPQVWNVAEDVAKALIENDTARSFFEGLPTFNRKNFIRWIESAKREETRSKRITKMVEMLCEGKTR